MRAADLLESSIRRRQRLERRGRISVALHLHQGPCAVEKYGRRSRRSLLECCQNRFVDRWILRQKQSPLQAIHL